MSAEESSRGARPKKQLVINAFVETCSGHQSPGLWRHPEDQSWRFNDIQHWIELAQLLEKGKFHGMFIADVLVRLLRTCRIMFCANRLTQALLGRVRCVQGP